MGKSALRQVVSIVIQLKRADDVATVGCRCSGGNPKRGPLSCTLQGFSAPRYVSTTFGLTCRNQRTALQSSASHPFSKVRAFQAKIYRHPRMPTSSGPSQGSRPLTRSMQTSAPGHPESALQRNPTAVASATSVVQAPVPASSLMEYGRPHALPPEPHPSDPSKFLMTGLRDIELMSTEAQSLFLPCGPRRP
jgi:hypothetical protein